MPGIQIFSEHLTASICLTLLLEVIYFVLQLWLCQNRSWGKHGSFLTQERDIWLSAQTLCVWFWYLFLGFFKCAFAVLRKLQFLQLLSKLLLSLFILFFFLNLHFFVCSFWCQWCLPVSLFCQLKVKMKSNVFLYTKLQGSQLLFFYFFFPFPPSPYCII